MIRTPAPSIARPTSSTISLKRGTPPLPEPPRPGTRQMQVLCKSFQRLRQRHELDAGNEGKPLLPGQESFRIGSFPVSRSPSLARLAGSRGSSPAVARRAPGPGRTALARSGILRIKDGYSRVFFAEPGALAAEPPAP